MRGGVSLAALLSIPIVAAGHPFPGRDESIFLTYMVLLGTLVVPGLTLGPLIQQAGGRLRRSINAEGRAGTGTCAPRRPRAH
jgi:CPA1 family monovalent cation:H+ antiporter